MNRASSATGWVRNPTIEGPDLDPHLASSYELGWTSNPLTGCSNGCSYCYARRLANGRLRSRYLANTNYATTVDFRNGEFKPNIDAPLDPFYPRFWPKRLKELEDRHTNNNRLSRPIGVFVCDMGDLFGIGVPEEWTRRVLDVICSQMIYPAENDRFYLLTKQPQNLAKFQPFPWNCWVGVTATDKASFDKAVYHLAEVAANIKYISIEPLLGSVLYDEEPFWGGAEWVILGAQTKPYISPQIEHVQEIVSAADRAGIPVFLKDNLKPLLETLNITGGTFGRLTTLTAEAAKDTKGLPRQRGWYQLRQEMPKQKGSRRGSSQLAPT